MVSQRSKALLHKIVLVLAAATIIVSVGIWALESALQEGKENTMNKRANFVAKCKSVGGEMGGDKCYINGVEVFSE